MSEAVIRAEGLEKRFIRQRVLRGVNFTLQRGQIVAIMGQNGAGKTTLLRILAGLLRAESGTLTYFDGTSGAENATLRRKLGVSLHAPMLYPDLSAAENLTFFAQLYGVQEVETRVNELLARVGLTAQHQQRVSTLSRGMTQRLSIARALINAPQILLLDEPFTGLDLDSAQKMEAVLREFCAEGGAVAYVSHDLGRIPDLADAAYILHAGIAEGPILLQGMHPAQLQERYAALNGGAA